MNNTAHGLFLLAFPPVSFICLDAGSWKGMLTLSSEKRAFAGQRAGRDWRVCYPVMLFALRYDPMMIIADSKSDCCAGRNRAQEGV